MDDNTNIRRRLSARTRNSRVRRMLNLDDIDNENGSTGSKPKSNDISNKDSLGFNEEVTVTSVNSSSDAQGQDKLKSSVGVELFTTMELRRQEVVNRYANNIFEELEEPFSPIVSEYIPISDSSYSEDSDSEENIQLPKNNKINRKSKKSPICQLFADYEVLDDIIPSSLNLTHVTNNDNIATPCSSLQVYRTISTPDSFKDVLQLVQNYSTKKYKNTDSSICMVNLQSLNNHCLVSHTSNKNKRCLSNDDLNYKKNRFVASTSIVYLEGDLNTEHVEHESLDLTLDEFMDPVSSGNNEIVSNNNMQCPIQSSSSILTESETNRSKVEIIEPDLNQRSRKRKRDESSWQVNKNKLLKNSGKRYHSKASKQERNCKVMGEPCTCKNKCNERIDNSARMSAFNAYWGLGNHERQWDFIARYVKTKPTRVVVINAKRPKTQTLLYSLPARNGHDLIKVCKKMFLQTLNINERTIFTALMKHENHAVTDLRGRHTNRHNKIDENTTKSVKDHINLFPRKESHYLRKQTQREYLDEKLNCAKLYRLYVGWMKDNSELYPNVKQATERWYYHIFTTQFNIGFFQPKKDKCEICSLYEEANSERKEQLQLGYDLHIKNKELVRKIKDEEKKTSDASTKTVACFDLEKVLSLPQSDVGVFHYKRKYPVYNFTVYNILKKSGHCYVWHAAIAKRGANEIASCLWSFLQAEAAKGINEISFYSDNCTGQNRNRFVFALYVHASLSLNLKITHRFLQKGHTQNEGDSMHSCIEKSKKNHILYIPEEIYAIIRNAKVNGQKYQVKEMGQEDFFDFKKLITTNTNWVKDMSGEKINWTKIKEISVDPLSPGKLQIRYEFDDETPTTVDTNRCNRTGRRKKTSVREDLERPSILSQLYEAPLPISANLYKDIMSMCRDNHIPPHYQTFYKSLRPQSLNSGDNFDEENTSDSD